MNYNELLLKLSKMPYLNPRIEQRINCLGKLCTRINLYELGECTEIDIFDSDLYDVRDYDNIIEIMKNEIQEKIKILQEVLKFIEKDM
jgi:hypothetical protein